MYYLVAFILILIGFFLIYKFYSQIDEYIKKHIIPSQKVIDIKKEMNDLDGSSNEENSSSKDENLSKFTKINDEINKLLYLPVDFLYKSAVSFGTPLFHVLRVPTDKNI
jgi:predicted PurR-regulated permease PerM